ncbi:MAG TPA: DUF4235 domain-containing protein [Streptosporangiaceae bacterium]|jgi:hypothetical protein
MSDKGGSAAVKVLASIAAFAAAFATRKFLTLAWRQATGKEPPTDPHDPHVGMGEALTWAVLIGAGIESARLLATRAATRNERQLSDDS